MRRCKALVLGAGLAGSAVCLRLCDLGLEPLWLSKTPADKKDKPGEHLAAGARTLLEQLTVGDLLARDGHREVHSVLSCWGSERLQERHALARLEGPGVILNRMAFERDLQQEAVDRGVEYIDAEITAVRSEAQGFVVEADGEIIGADFVFDATGRRAVLASSLTQLFRADQLLAAYTFASRADGIAELPAPITLVEAVRGGWWYGCLLADGRLSLAYFTDSDLLPRGLTQDPACFLELLKETHHLYPYVDKSGFVLSETPGVASAGTSWLAPCAGKNWVAVGDAAAAFDPLSAHGMTTALWTGIAAADAYSATLNGEDAPLSDYALKVARGLQSYLESREQMYTGERRYAEDPFWARRRVISRATIANRTTS